MARVMLAEALAAHLTEAFGAADLPIIVIKGPVLSRWLYTGDELRNLGDLDVIVDPRFL